MEFFFEQFCLHSAAFGKRNKARSAPNDGHGNKCWRSMRVWKGRPCYPVIWNHAYQRDFSQPNGQRKTQNCWRMHDSLNILVYGKAYLCALSTMKIAYTFLNGIVRSPLGVVVAVNCAIQLFLHRSNAVHTHTHTLAGNQHYYSSLRSTPMMEIASKW